jgi:hypothetical protein
VAEEPWIYGYSVMGKIQMTSFCVQEVTMSTLYLIYTRKLTIDKRNTSIVRQTMYLNALVLILDLSMLICEYVGLYEIQIMLKVVVCTFFCIYFWRSRYITCGSAYLENRLYRFMCILRRNVTRFQS